MAKECKSCCGWFRLGRVSRSGESLLRVELRKTLIDWVEPRGRPNRVVPLSQGEKGMCVSGNGSAEGVDTEVRMHFSSLTFRSVGRRRERSCWKARETSSGGPKMLPSSRYHEWKELGERWGREEMMG